MSSVPADSLFSTVADQPRIRKNPGFQLNAGLAFSVPHSIAGGATQSYQTIILQPMYNWQALTVMLDIHINFYFTLGNEPTFGFKIEDWMPDSLPSALEAYLPLFFLQYGRMHEDIHMLYGPLHNVHFGNGTVVRNYTNTVDSVNARAAGILTKVDGKAFDFPYFGIEAMVGDLAHLDVVASRLFIRPLAFLDQSLSDSEVGFSVAIDRASQENSPYASIETLSTPYSLTFGTDLIIPLISHRRHAIELFGDFLWQDSALGGVGGIRAHTFDLLIIEAAIQYMQPGSYLARFDRNVSLYGTEYHYSPSHEYLGGAFRLGFTFLDESLLLEFSGEGPIIDIPLHDGFTVGGQIRFQSKGSETPVGFHVSLHYQKKFITAVEDMLSLDHSIIGGKIGLTFSTISVEFISELRPTYAFLHGTSSTPYEITMGLKGVVTF